MEDASREAFCRSISAAALTALLGDLFLLFYKMPGFQHRRAYAVVFTAACTAANWLLSAEAGDDLAQTRSCAAPLLAIRIEDLTTSSAVLEMDRTLLRTNACSAAGILSRDGAVCSLSEYAALQHLLQAARTQQHGTRFTLHKMDLSRSQTQRVPTPAWPSFLMRQRLYAQLLSERAVDALEELIVFVRMIQQGTCPEDPLRIVVTAEADGRSNRTATLHTLDPATIFADVARSVHCVVLASGTLAPLTSFESELGVSFPLRMEGRHVIDADRQLLATHLGRSGSGATLRCVHSTTSTDAFRDALGETLQRLIACIPNGVLVFLPSYTLANALRQHWQATGRWASIGGCKRVFCEPQSAAPAIFADMLTSYYAAAGEGEGAVLFAVFRGRCSEGMDFADTRARAVISVGVPLPNLKSGMIEAKMAYNDARRVPGRLNGNEWYTLQAWRALNQALGRCIRHKSDHGALILIDARFGERNGIASLSRWVRERMVPATSVAQLETDLRTFFESQ